MECHRTIILELYQSLKAVQDVVAHIVRRIFAIVILYPILIDLHQSSNFVDSNPDSLIKVMMQWNCHTKGLSQMRQPGRE